MFKLILYSLLSWNSRLLVLPLLMGFQQQICIIKWSAKLLFHDLNRRLASPHNRFLKFSTGDSIICFLLLPLASPTQFILHLLLPSIFPRLLFQMVLYSFQYLSSILDSNLTVISCISGSSFTHTPANPRSVSSQLCCIPSRQMRGKYSSHCKLGTRASFVYVSVVGQS